MKRAPEDVDFPLGNEDDETNTVIENECDNDYDNIYQSLEDDLEVPE